MKKLSISLFAVLAILVAVSSAFTTAKRSIDDPNWFVLNGAAQSSTFQQEGTTIGNFDYLPTYANTTPMAIEDAAEECPASSGLVCAARIDSHGGTLDQTDLNALGLML
jgi:hypothetical protein